MSSKKKTQNIFATAAARTAAYEAHKAKESAQAEKRKSDNRFALIVSGGAVVVALLLQFAYFGFGPGHTTPTADPSAAVENSADVPKPAVSLNREWVGTMEVGGQKLDVRLDGEKAPQAVSVFLTLAKNNFYNEISCHRLTTSGIFVLQCGDPNGDGTGGPGYSWGPIENAPADNNYKEGVLAFARQSGNGSSMGSQFFIVYKDSPIPADAAGGYTVFGTITKGLSKLDKVINAGTADGTGDGKPAIETKLGAISLN